MKTKTKPKASILFATFFIAISSVSTGDESVRNTANTPANPPDPSKWELKWEEDFEGDRLDDSNWTRCERGTPDWMNTMSDDPRLLKVDGGVLHLRGIVNDKKDEDPAPYLTAGVTSKGKFSFLYGKVQIRARFKSAQGAWPALWMLGSEKGWPANGEIDLMEHLNFDHKVYQTVHSEYTLKVDKTALSEKTGRRPFSHKLILQ